ncbi:amidohydrolase [Kineococcus arenarius]|uniref:amidohydrolase n=1 Tax=Kineococcus sp. SYSU DK007 TaxID=3383128 RepID=UPI003D7D0F74
MSVAGERLQQLAEWLHDHPEVSGSEHRSARHLTTFLEQEGFQVQLGVGSQPTAFTAVAGSGALTVALCVEYDALPAVGHACGHHLIAGAGVGAALGLLPLLQELDITVKVIGTPAEEHGAGKALLLADGAFDDVAFSLMVHPVQEGYSANPVGTSSQAAGRFRAVFTGRAAHAAAAPHLGVNAGDAATLAQVAIGLLRQQVPGNQRIGLYVVSGGAATNIIPERAVVDFECRAPTLQAYETLLTRVRRCFEAGALATGAALEITATEPLYEPLRQDEDLAEHWNSAIASFGHWIEPAPLPGTASTDMGNISQAVPSIHPWVSLPGVHDPIHSHGFTLQSRTPAAFTTMLQCATAMAWTVQAVAASPPLRASLMHRQQARPTATAAQR